jgi:hypothetical protein
MAMRRHSPEMSPKRICARARRFGQSATSTSHGASIDRREGFTGLYRRGRQDCRIMFQKMSDADDPSILG